MKKILCITLVLVLLLSVLPVTAFAAGGTSRYDAIPVTFEEVYTHTWTADNDDKDHFVQFSISRRMLAIVCSWPVDSEGYYYDVAFELYDQEGTLVWQNSTVDYEVTESVFAMMTGLSNGTYYLNIKPLFEVEQGEFQIAYALSYENEEIITHVETEPNNTQQTSTYMSANSTYYGTLGETGGNDDYWCYTNNDYGTYRIYFSEVDALLTQNSSLTMFHIDGLGRKTSLTSNKAIVDEYGDKYFKVVSTLGKNYIGIESTETPTFMYALAVAPHDGKAVDITKQPVPAAVKNGQTATVSLTAVGDSLKYAWYYKDTTSTDFALATGYTGSSYSVTMNANRSGRLVYCVVTDKYGNTEQSETVMIGLEGESVSSGTCGENVRWNLDNMGVLTISGTGAMTEKPWLEAYRNDIKKVVILSGVTEIVDGAFSRCDLLSEVVLPNTVAVIGNNAFMSCNDLESIVLPEGVKKIGDRAFESADLQSIQIPNTVTYIGENAFWSSMLRSVTIPGSVETFGSGAFSACYYLTDVKLGKGITAISKDMFSGNYNLEKVVIPEGVTSIGEDAFWGCSDLKALYIPKSVVSIDRNALSNCERLTDIYYAGSAEDKEQIEIHSDNKYNATWHYNVVNIPGDLDNNFQVNSDDVVQLLLHISMPDLFPITVNADYTGDGKITSDDVVQLLLHISMPDLFPLG